MCTRIRRKAAVTVPRSNLLCGGTLCSLIIHGVHPQREGSRLFPHVFITLNPQNPCIPLTPVIQTRPFPLPPMMFMYDTSYGMSLCKQDTKTRQIKRSPELIGCQQHNFNLLPHSQKQTAGGKRGFFLPPSSTPTEAGISHHHPRTQFGARPHSSLSGQRSLTHSDAASPRASSFVERTTQLHTLQRTIMSSLVLPWANKTSY